MTAENGAHRAPLQNEIGKLNDYRFLSVLSYASFLAISSSRISRTVRGISTRTAVADGLASAGCGTAGGAAEDFLAMQGG